MLEVDEGLEGHLYYDTNTDVFSPHVQLGTMFNCGLHGQQIGFDVSGRE